MAEVRAVLVPPDAPACLALGTAQSPSPNSSEVLVRVAGNLAQPRRSEPLASGRSGLQPRWDLAGTVEKAADDGTGPSEGSRVVGLMTASVGLVVRLVGGFTGKAVSHVED